MDKAEKPNLKQWRETIQRYEQSAQTQTQFCRDNDLKPHQFFYYLKKFRMQLNEGRPLDRKMQKVSFTPISISGSGPGYQIFLPNGIRLTLPQGFDITVTKQLIEALL